MKSWHDVPFCDCGGPMVTVPAATFNHRAGADARIVCCACGDGKHGTDAEYERARRADAAWEGQKRIGMKGAP